MVEKLFVNKKDSNRFCLFQLGKEWDETFVVEMFDNDEATVCWGNTHYVEKDRKVITDFLTYSFLPDSNDEWKEVSEKTISSSPRMKDVVNCVKQKIDSFKRSNSK